MIKYIKQEIAKDDFDGLDAKDVRVLKIYFFSLTFPSHQLCSRFTISIVSNSIYNVDPKTFEGQESEILKISQIFTVPTKKFMIIILLTTLYPFLSRYLKFSFARPGATDFFVELMNKAMKHREEHKIQRIDYLDHLMNLKNKKEISGESS